MTGPENAQGQFPVIGNATDTFTFGGSVKNPNDQLIGTVTWDYVTDGGLSPHFVGSVAITTLAGQAALTSNFASLVAGIDLTYNVDTSLSDLALTTNSEGGIFSNGVVSPEASATPLPSALPLFASGIFGLLILRKKRKKLKIQ